MRTVHLTFLDNLLLRKWPNIIPIWTLISGVTFRLNIRDKFSRKIFLLPQGANQRSLDYKQKKLFCNPFSGLVPTQRTLSEMLSHNVQKTKSTWQSDLSSACVFISLFFLKFLWPVKPQASYTQRSEIQFYHSLVSMTTVLTFPLTVLRHFDRCFLKYFPSNYLYCFSQIKFALQLDTGMKF